MQDEVIPAHKTSLHEERPSIKGTSYEVKVRAYQVNKAFFAILPKVDLTTIVLDPCRLHIVLQDARSQSQAKVRQGCIVFR